MKIISLCSKCLKNFVSDTGFAPEIECLDANPISCYECGNDTTYRFSESSQKTLRYVYEGNNYKQLRFDENWNLVK